MVPSPEPVPDEFQMVPSPEPVPDEFQIVADVRYSDAVFATLAQFSRRGRIVLRVYALALTVSIGVAWITGGVWLWLPVVLGFIACGAVGSVVWLVGRDFRLSGGKPLRMRFHICDSGVEVRAAGRGDWMAWEDVWDAEETRRSFLVSPGPGEHYVIPKRCCDTAAVEGLREALRTAGALVARG